MKIDITSRIFFAFLILYISIIYLVSPEDPRPYFKNFAYILAGLGILRLFINVNLGFSLSGNIPFSSYRKILDRSAIILLNGFAIGAFCFHFIDITYEFRNSFFLGERDFTSMGEVILNVSKGFGYYSPFHGDGNSSYLSHHFSPGIIAYVPFFQIFQDRIALAWGQLFIALAIILFLIYLLKQGEKSEEILHPKWHLLWLLVILGNIYSYRLALSYHFEILFVFYFLLLYFVRSKKQESSNEIGGQHTTVKKWIALEILMIFLILTVKEDTVIYLFLYYLGEFLYSYAINKKFPLHNFSVALILLLYFAFFQNAVRSHLGVDAQEDWYAIWGHWIGSVETDNLEKMNTKLNLIGSLLGSILGRPLLVWDAIVSKSGIVWEICLGFGFLFFLAPRYWFYILTVMLIHFLSGREWHNSFYNYYIYSLLPVLWIASLEGFKKLIQLSLPKSGFALGFLVLALVMYRNSGDKNFPFSEFSARSYNSGTNTTHLSEKEKMKRILEIEILSNKIPAKSKVGVQFDLGIFIPVCSQIYPLGETPISNGKKLDHIITNSQSGFSPYVELGMIQSWEQNWIENYGYKLESQEGDFKLYSNEMNLRK